jgi:hypothetical protein
LTPVRPVGIVPIRAYERSNFNKIAIRGRGRGGETDELPKSDIAGNATADPESKVSKDEKTTYVRFNVGVSTGKDKTTFFPVVVFGEYGATVAKFVRKGSGILVEGRIRVSDSGRFSVIADHVEFDAGPRPEGVE